MPGTSLKTEQPAFPLASEGKNGYDRAMIQAIVYDMGNVLMKFNPDYLVSQFTKDPDDQAALLSAIFRSPQWPLLDEGVFDEGDMCALIRKRLPPRLVETGIAAYQNWHLHCQRIPEAEALVSQLKAAGYKQYLLSNAATRWQTYWQQFPAMTMLDGHVVSAFVRAVKPDPAIYRILMDTYGLKPEECFFIDDLAANVEAAKALGMDGFVLDRFQYDELRLALKERGVKI